VALKIIFSIPKREMTLPIVTAKKYAKTSFKREIKIQKLRNKILFSSFSIKCAKIKIEYYKIKSI